MKVLFGFIALFCSFLGGYSWGLRHSADGMRQLAVDLTSGDSGVPATSLSYAMSVVTETGKDETTPLKGNQRSPGPPTVALALDHVQRSSHEEELWKAMGDDKAGTQLRRLLVASPHSSELPGADLYIQNFHRSVGEDPQPWVDDIHGALDRIPLDGFPLERTALLMMMGSAVQNNEQVKTQALNELVGNPIPARPDPAQAQTEEELNASMSTTPATALPLAAEAVYLNQTSDPTEALGGTVQGIVAQPDKGIRFSLAMEFVQKYPSLRGDLLASLQGQGVQLNLGGGR